jgi:hypothetical protein
MQSSIFGRKTCLNVCTKFSFFVSKNVPVVLGECVPDEQKTEEFTLAIILFFQMCYVSLPVILNLLHLGQVFPAKIKEDHAV